MKKLIAFILILGLAGCSSIGIDRTKPVFPTDNIIRITFCSAGSTADDGVVVPDEHLAEIAAWLGTFTIDQKVKSDALAPGSNSVSVRIEYADGTIVKSGISTTEVDGVSYYMKSEGAPEYYHEIFEEIISGSKTADDKPDSASKPVAYVAPLEFRSFDELEAAAAGAGTNNGELAGLTHYYVPTIPDIVLENISVKERYLCIFYRIRELTGANHTDPDEAEIARISGTVKLEWIRNADGDALLANTIEQFSLVEIGDGVYSCDITYPTRPDVVLSKSLYWVCDGYMFNLDIPLAMYEVLMAEHGSVGALTVLDKIPIENK